MTDDEPSKDRIDKLLERINYLESVTREALSRLHAIEKQLGTAQRPPAPPPRPPFQPRRELPSPYDVRPPVAPPEATTPPYASSDVPPAANIPPAPPMNAAQPPPPSSPYRGVLNVPPPRVPPPGFAQASRPKASTDLESRIGGSWFNRIGVIAVAIGVIFFLKYAYDNAWIGPREAVIICIIIGFGFLILGERLRPRYHNYAYGLTGGGILILYSSFFAASKFNLLGTTLAFICMAIVTATASLLAARYNALPIAVLGLIGGFLTPILLSTGQDNEAGLFGYIALLDLGVLALAYSKQWRALNYMAFASTVAMFTAWWWTWYTPEKLWPTMIFLTLFFSIFALLAVLYNVVNRRPTRWLDLAMVFINALLYFGTSYALLESKYDAYLGVFAVLVSAFYLALGYFTYERDREDRLLLYTFWGLAILFLVLAVPIQFKQHWITMGWAIEGAILTWIGLRVEDKTSRYGALIVFLIALSHWLLVDAQDFAYRANEAFTPLLNRRALSSGVLVAALAAAAVFYKRLGAKLDEAEQSMFAGLYTLGANALAVTLLSLDANDYFELMKGQAYAESGYRESFFNSARWSELNNARHLTLSALWAVYATTTLFVGLKRNITALRMGALALLAIAGAKLLVKDLSYYEASWHQTLLNPTFGAFVIFIAACAIGAWLYVKADAVDKGERSLVFPALIGIANLFAILALSAEIIGHFERAKAAFGDQPVAHIENTKQFALSAVWIIYGTLGLLAGIKRNRRFVRMAALALLALATAKVIAVDLQFYNVQHLIILNQTFAAFALLVAALSIGIWFYSRATNITEGEQSQFIPVMIASANLLAILALSAEAYSHYAMQIKAGNLTDAGLRDLRLAQQLSLSVIWTIYGGALLTVGIMRRSRLLRLMALLLLSISIGKVFLLDSSYLAQGYRIVSFIALGAILLAVSFLYQRYRERVSRFIGDADNEAQAGVE